LSAGDLFILPLSRSFVKRFFQSVLDSFDWFLWAPQESFFRVTRVLEYNTTRPSFCQHLFSKN
ncbi:MAG: hypothetical protein H9864_01175, partial [Candidatus Faecalibacterium intestinavium]|nr:hypothetical protein [Candidatus Faecalibacterium intestinavium]